MTAEPAAGRGARIHLGTQGWDYPAWIGPFYPPGTKPPDFLSVYSRAFDTVEVDSTYHAVPAEHVVRGWADRVPASFRFALKLPLELTPETGPTEPAALAAFGARARLLGEKLGPILVQLGPAFTPSAAGALERFVAALPTELRWAMEFRHRGWPGPPLLDLLTRHGVALVLVEGRAAHSAATIELAIHPTTDFAYVRWIGVGERFADVGRMQVERDGELSKGAMLLAALAARVPAVYGYFANQFQGHAPASVREMERLIGRRPVDPATLAAQTSLF